MIKKYFLVVIFLFLCSCASVVQTIDLQKDKVYAVIPFENYTDTPLAGYTIASTIEGSLRSQGLKVSERQWIFNDREPTKEEIDRIFKKASQNADYIITGTVNEFRYKTGIDGEPTVSLSIFIYDTQKGVVVKGASGAWCGWAHESLGTVSQKLVREIFKLE
ncbi:hypothetical protein TAGGR_1158 [Thermodesulfovibrio aggregans]|uniref:Penicillin-binding protein activator LpoB n=1 Tax=Thermodesulfovibrio aggregans TaxID=86166 RepID=A0A0U9HNE2_9BACT|nr:DUF4136 domain-containing protein [Thermodesulfovibrio aggregans]GAQ93993.1 hypothetical protein TAGGR_1158 [Thermodesulfovibrio aggregans]